MSFEGYYQILCENGHYETHDVYTNGPEYFKCSTCGEDAKWWNLVDLTNGSYTNDGTRIDGFVHFREMEVFACRCDKCGIVHTAKPSIYEIPKDKGHLKKV